MGHSALQANLDAQTVRLDHFILLLQGISERTAVPREASLNRTLLDASLIKIINSAMAARLLVDAHCVEEILSIGRTMVEVTVNLAYLQHASDKEMERFLRFHPETAFKHTTMLSAPVDAPSQDSLFSRFSKKVTRGILTPQSARLDPTWSKYSLLDRAQIADEKGQIPVMNLLVRRCAPRGQAAVQGAVDSLDYYISALEGSEGARPENRMVALTEAIFGINLCLFTLAFYLSAFFNLNMDRALEQAANAQPLGLGTSNQTRR